MTETTQEVRRPRQKRIVELEEFKQWLTDLESRPRLHVNGAVFTTAVLTVDFGTPLEEFKLSPETVGELTNRMRVVTKALCKEKDINVRVQTDNSNGIWWTSIG